MEILLFGGTSEGRMIAEWAESRDLRATVCVATEYGAGLLTRSKNIRIMTGRLNSAEMGELMRSGDFSYVVDATHPYAPDVTDNIKVSARDAGITVVRVVRESETEGDWIWAASAEHAAELLTEMSGNILLTTGSKNLDAFAGRGLTGRCYPRVLPNPDSLNRCLELGYPGSNILCMHGPFSAELNAAIIRQYAIKAIVTKATGSVGGFDRKAEAARETGCDMIVIGVGGREEGISVRELIDRLERELGGVERTGVI